MEEKIHKIRIKAHGWNLISLLGYEIEESKKTNYATISLSDEKYLELKKKIEDFNKEIKKIEQEKEFKEYNKKVSKISVKLSNYINKITEKYQKGY